MGVEGLNPKVPNSERSESGRLFYTDFKIELGLRQKRLDFSPSFSITTLLSLKLELLRA